MLGKRIYPNEQGKFIFGDPGSYGKDTDGTRWACVPEPGFPWATLTLHEVTEHEDGTITVSPSILIDGAGGKTWHGFLEHGVWREV